MTIAVASLGSTSPAGSTSSGSFAATAAIQSGDTVVVSAGHRAGSTPTVSSVTDGVNTYVKAVGLATADTNAELWKCENAQAVASPTITVNLSGAVGASGWYISAARVGGVKRSAALDKTNSSASLSVSTGALSQASEVVFGLGTVFAAGGFTPSSGFTQLSNQQAVTNFSMSLEYQIVNSAASVTYNPSASNTEPAVRVATFIGTAIVGFNMPMLGM